MAKSMLKVKSLPKTFWEKAITLVVFLLNRCPAKAIFRRTPKKAWNGYKPELFFFRIFWCITYSHIPKEHKKKV